ncbi:MAG TPA: hypothetical protein VF403_03605 [Kofleriaceae bacterium]
MTKTRVFAGIVGAVVGAVATIIAYATYARPSALAAQPIHGRRPGIAEPPAARYIEPSAPASAAAPCAEDPRVKQLVAEVAEQTALISSNPDAVLPAEYPAGMPDLYRERSFRGVIESALHDCLPDTALVDISCDEPPCVAVLALRRKPAGYDDRPEPLDRCDAWKRAYGRESRISYGDVDCGGGRKEQVEVIGPELGDWDGWKLLDDESREHINSREWPRVKKILARYRCAR